MTLFDKTPFAQQANGIVCTGTDDQIPINAALAEHKLLRGRDVPIK